MSERNYEHVIAAFRQASATLEGKQRMDTFRHNKETSFDAESWQQYGLAIKLMRSEGFCAREMIDEDDSVMFCVLRTGHSGACEQG